MLLLTVGTWPGSQVTAANKRHLEETEQQQVAFGIKNTYLNRIYFFFFFKPEIQILVSLKGKT